ncbi:MAG: aminotransferase class III-fold pyridoxal phosphate-dependent enzyme, partial [Pseudomonadota bacterium]
GGVPLGALLATNEVSCFEHGDQGGTYNGNPLMCAAGLAVLDQVSKPEFLAHINKAGAHLQMKLGQLAGEFGLGATRGSGLLIALDLGREVAPEIVAKAMENGLLLNAPRADSLRFMPALNVSIEEIDEAVSILDLVLSEMG